MTAEAELKRPTDYTDKVIELFKLEDDLRALGVPRPDHVIEQLDRLGWSITKCRGYGRGSLPKGLDLQATPTPAGHHP